MSTDPSTDPLAEFERHRRTVDVDGRPASVVDTGGPGPAALFVHGVGTSSLLWRNVIAAMRGERRCVAVDLPVHGSTPARPGDDVTIGGLATFVAGCRDALGLDAVDLVGNDTGGAVSQVVAAREPDRVRTLTLTDCDTVDNLPPKAFLAVVLLARAGLLAPQAKRALRNPALAKRRLFGPGYRTSTGCPTRWHGPGCAPPWARASQRGRSSAASPPCTPASSARTSPRCAG